MKHDRIALCAGIVALALAGCATVPAVRDAAGVYFVRDAMVNAINPPTEAMWNMQVEVMDDFGNFDPALMTEASWTALIANARALHNASQSMAIAGTYLAADPEGDLTDAPEGTDLMAVQARLAANPQAYRAFSQALERHSAQLVTAAEARDAAQVTELVNDLQPVCKACHDVFWYPEEYAP